MGSAAESPQGEISELAYTLHSYVVDGGQLSLDTLRDFIKGNSTNTLREVAELGLDFPKESIETKRYHNLGRLAFKLSGEVNDTELLSGKHDGSLPNFHSSRYTSSGRSTLS